MCVQVHCELALSRSRLTRSCVVGAEAKGADRLAERGLNSARGSAQAETQKCFCVTTFS